MNEGARIQIGAAQKEKLMTMLQADVEVRYFEKICIFMVQINLAPTILSVLFDLLVTMFYLL